MFEEARAGPRSGAEASQVRMSVELCAFYWHFLLAIWLFLFFWFVIT